MPITERYVIEFIRWQSIQDQPIDGIITTKP